jgi:putative phosphoesterase
MRVAVISDIHGNRRALHAVLADLETTAPDLVVHGGDLAFGGGRPAEVIDEIQTLGWAGVYGNADEILWCQSRLSQMAANPKFAPLASALMEMTEATLAKVGEQRVQWLKALPIVHRHPEFVLVHASPSDAWTSPQAAADPQALRDVYAPLHASIVVYGHIHVPFISRTPALTVVNTGSVGQSYDGDRRASYLLLTDQLPEIRRVEYDVEGEARDLRRSGLPHAEWLSRILLAGRYCPLQE